MRSALTFHPCLRSSQGWFRWRQGESCWKCWVCKIHPTSRGNGNVIVHSKMLPSRTLRLNIASFSSVPLLPLEVKRIYLKRIAVPHWKAPKNLTRWKWGTNLVVWLSAGGIFIPFFPIIIEMGSSSSNQLLLLWLCSSYEVKLLLAVPEIEKTQPGATAAPKCMRVTVHTDFNWTSNCRAHKLYHVRCYARKKPLWIIRPNHFSRKKLSAIEEYSQQCSDCKYISGAELKVLCL